MASKRKSKPNAQSRPRRSGSLDSPTEEVNFVLEVDTGGDSVPKDSYLVLKRAFDDVKQKLILTRKEKNRLQERSNALFKDNKLLESKVKYFESENETLKTKVELSFQAYDEKYKDNEKLKKELQAIKEGEGSRNSEDKGEEQQNLAVQTGETATQTKVSFDSLREENETVDTCTQTSEEKTDEVGCIPSSTPMKLLKNCGLEIVFQNRNYYLVLSDRDLLKQWLENETDGKVSVAFEKTPVFERFVQTDIEMVKEQIHCKECPENKTIIIQLKNKIVDQANLIKRYREQQSNMADLLGKKESKMVLSTSVMVQTEGKFYDEHSMKKQAKTLTKYKNKVLKSMQMLEQKLIQLKKELDYQHKFSKRLLDIIHGTMQVPKDFVSSLLNAVEGKSEKIAKSKKPPVPRAFLGDESLEYFEVLSPPESYSSFQPPLSLPVQETDRRLRVKISKPKDPDYDPSLDEEAFAENRSLTSESSASIVPAEEAQHTLVVDKVATSNRGDVLPTPPTSGTSSHMVEQASRHDDSDEIVVIDENEAGAVGDSGAKECPICYILYTPGTSQQEYEKHVMDHFKDFES